ncbi:Lecithin:cholesterol acyltransferase family protein [Zostera marina]|uniref:Lecithin:cholesterol acyltransferase family protein n=1 Tax=Zostera marina TaxID=29655 RepID=A0A0K9Q2K0_ZOSMR|nr:Lecithin:cholesterol acyltransferase family protein [Zostera marina]
MLTPMLCIASTGSNHGLHPLILVPGSGGNQLEARLTNSYSSSSFICDPWIRSDTRNEKWYRIWFDLSIFLPPFAKCFAERLTLRFDTELDDYRNAVGVETRVPFFGSTTSLLCSVPRFKGTTEYMDTLVKSFKDMGYREEENLFGAPHDFRYGLAAKGVPCRVGTQYLNDLKQLIENATNSNGGKPVIIVSHSMGGLLVLHLLNRNPLSWRKKYIKHFIALSTPWGGAVQVMLTYASGYTLGVPLVDPLTVRHEQRSWESNLWLLPSSKVFDDEKPLVISEKGSYKASNMTTFLKDIGYPEGVELYKKRIVPLVEDEQSKPPMVPITSFVGSGVDTAELLVYGKNGFDEQPKIVYGDGDGTVNTKSLMAAERMWEGVKEQRFKTVKLAMVSHTDILMDEFAISEIGKQISEINFNSF